MSSATCLWLIGACLTLSGLLVLLHYRLERDYVLITTTVRRIEDYDSDWKFVTLAFELNGAPHVERYQLAYGFAKHVGQHLEAYCHPDRPRSLRIKSAGSGPLLFALMPFLPIPFLVIGAFTQP